MLVYQHDEGVLWITMLSDYQGNIWASDLAGLVKISYHKNFKTSITKDEIFKYGAKGFKIEKISPPYQKHGEDNSVFALNKDEQGNIWVGCAEGLYILKNRQHTFIRLRMK